MLRVESSLLKYFNILIHIHELYMTVIIYVIYCNRVIFLAFDNPNPNVKNISLNTKGIVFYSTPHKGSRLANLNQAAALLLWPSVEVQELREGMNIFFPIT